MHDVSHLDLAVDKESKAAIEALKMLVVVCLPEATNVNPRLAASSQEWQHKLNLHA